ncbi:MAG: hypothetical protein QGG36_23730 [Pirellulaceae bacterium]|nr:hypothetical protein [Psychrobacter sp.]MDP7018832.1 hypothetical protein [Pirellulaceae bacterium]
MPIYEAEAVDQNAEKQPNAAAERDRFWGMLNNGWVVLAILFFVTACIGLPLLWRSTSFSPVSKAIWTVIVLAYTGLIFWVFILLMAWCYGEISGALR